MKTVRPTQKEMESAATFIQKCIAIKDKDWRALIAYKSFRSTMEIEESLEELEALDDDDLESKIDDSKLLEYITDHLFSKPLDIAAYILFVFEGCIMNPENELIDLNSECIEKHPKIIAALAKVEGGAV